MVTLGVLLLGTAQWFADQQDAVEREREAREALEAEVHENFRKNMEQWEGFEERR